MGTYLLNRNKLKQLSKLKPTEIGVVTGFSDEIIGNKLMEMGCLPGELVRVLKIAPFGDPMAIQVAGYELSLRMNEADCVLVHENPPEVLIEL